MAADVPKRLYLVVVDEENGCGAQEVSCSHTSLSPSASPHSFRYTRPMLQSTLQLMGCKVRHAFKISRRVFEVFETDCSPGDLNAEKHMPKLHLTERSSGIKNGHNDISGDNVGEGDMMPFELYKRLTTVVVTREIFLNVVCEALSEYKYVGPNQRADLVLACRIRERKESFTILLSGTSGCGKSTLSALLMGLMKKHPSIIPFMIYITNEAKHMERFSVRAKYMTLDPAKNKYVKYIRNIRTIQEYLCKRADRYLVPKINNTNVDKSVAVIHATVFSCLRRRGAGEQLYDPITNTVPAMDEEYRNQCAANSLSSKRMFQLIRRKGSSRQLMALMNIDGSVAKAWPIQLVNANGSRSGSAQCFGSPTYGPLQIGKAEPVNLQFGNFGISAWPSDAGGTSCTESMDELRNEDTDSESRNYSSYSSSPRISEGTAKELKEEFSLSSSDEADDQYDIDSDEDLSDVVNKGIAEEMEGSVDEELTKSDEEYEDLLMQDRLRNMQCCC